MTIFLAVNQYRLYNFKIAFNLCFYHINDIYFFNYPDIRLFDALNLAMSIVSTGGLPTNSLDQIIKNKTQEIFLIISMIIPFLNLFFFLNVFNKNNLLTKYKEDIYLLFFAIIFSLILLFSIDSLTIYEILISVISSMSNSGLAITEVSKNITLYFLLLTTVGGSVISLTSGIKFLRFYILRDGCIRNT